MTCLEDIKQGEKDFAAFEEEFSLIPHTQGQLTHLRKQMYNVLRGGSLSDKINLMMS